MVMRSGDGMTNKLGLVFASGAAIAVAVTALLVVVSSGGPSAAACAGPLVEVEPMRAAPGQHTRVKGQYFNTGCEDIGPNARGGFGSAEDIELYFEQGEQSVLLAVLDADEDGRISRVVRLPESAEQGPADIRAAVPVQESGGDPLDGVGRLTVTGSRQTGRVAGDDRVATAVAVSRRAFPEGAAVVYLARVDSPVDAIVGGVLTDGPILLVPSCSGLPTAVVEEVRRLQPGLVMTLGGQAAVCDQTLEEAATT